jgi:hypothetical protein
MEADKLDVFRYPEKMELLLVRTRSRNRDEFILGQQLASARATWLEKLVTGIYPSDQPRQEKDTNSWRVPCWEAHW